MAGKKIFPTIYITEDQKQKLKELHRCPKVPMSVSIREGIDLIPERYQSVLPGQIPLGVDQPLRFSFDPFAMNAGMRP